MFRNARSGAYEARPTSKINGLAPERVRIEAGNLALDARNRRPELKRAFFVWSLGFVFSFGVSAHALAAEPDWSAVDKVFGATGKDLPGGVHRLGWPRTDLRVTIAGTPVEPALALGSWGGFVRTGKDDEAMTMGDLVLLEAEVTPAITALLAGGLDVLAIHNHLINESPHIVYVHFAAHGDPATLARALKGALQTTKTPMAPVPSKTELTPAQQQTFKNVQDALGRAGTMAGKVLQVGVPRAEKLEEHGMEVPASMGMGISMNFQLVGEKVATTGDFVLIASEVNPVIRELRGRGLDVTALHSHMLEESPRLFFMHFWGVDTPEKIGGALKAALSKVSTKK